MKMFTWNRRNFGSWLPAWSMDIFFLTLLLIGSLGVIGALIGKLSFCSGVPGEDFWVGCEAELLGFSLGGAALGALISLRASFLLKK